MHEFKVQLGINTFYLIVLITILLPMMVNVSLVHYIFHSCRASLCLLIQYTYAGEPKWILLFIHMYVYEDNSVLCNKHAATLETVINLTRLYQRYV